MVKNDTTSDNPEIVDEQQKAEEVNAAAENWKRHTDNLRKAVKEIQAFKEQRKIVKDYTKKNTVKPSKPGKKAQ